MYERHHELLEICLEAKKKGHDIFFSYRAHVNKITIQIHENGWKPDIDPNETFEFYIDDSSVALEAIAYINDLLREDKDV